MDANGIRTFSNNSFVAPVMDENVSPVSYKSIYAARSMFRMAGGKYDPFNGFETPGLSFFKLFFYFDNHSESDGMGQTNNSNLLSLDVDTYTLQQGFSRQNPTYQDHTFANSALNYLLINNEYERAEKLLQFIRLLSNINTYSPWYFSELQGLGEALTRNEFKERDFRVEEQRKYITIKCLPDAADQRIGTLIDLYKDVSYSYILKKEIIPANLRKFDMGAFIFNTPINGLHRYPTGRDGYTGPDDYASFNEPGLANEQSYMSSVKYIEFHNCEIDTSSLASGIDTISNVEGTSHEYSIKLFFDTCYESRYNEFILRDIGDHVFADLMQDVGGEDLMMYMQGDIPEANITMPEGARYAAAEKRNKEEFDTRTEVNEDMTGAGMFINTEQRPDFTIPGGGEETNIGVNMGSSEGPSIGPIGAPHSLAPFTWYNMKRKLMGNPLTAYAANQIAAALPKPKEIYLGNIYTGEGAKTIQSKLNKAASLLREAANGTLLTNSINRAISKIPASGSWTRR